MTAPVPVDYSAREYDTIKQALIARIPSLAPEWRNRTENDFGIVLIELFAFMGDMLSFYIDRAANESSIDTAVLRESVLSFANLIGYTVRDMSPASGAVTFTTTAGRTVDLVIPAGTPLLTSSVNSDTSPLPFTTDVDLTILSSTTTGTVEVTQGKVVTDEKIGVSTGSPSQTFSLFETGVVTDSVLVDIVSDDITTRWGRVETLLGAGPTDQVYSIVVDTNDVATVTFGDGANGLVPPQGTVLQATYRKADGAKGDVGTGSITVLPTVITDVVSVTNVLAISGGFDRETIDDIRKALPGSIKAINRAVTPEDFEPLAEQVPGVLHAKAVADVYTSVLIYVVPTGGGSPSMDLATSVEDYLSTRSLIGTDTTVMTPAYVGVNVTLNLFVLSTFFTQETEDRVNDALIDFFNLANVDLGMTVTVSALYKKILAVPGVDYIEITLMARTDHTQSGTVSQVYAANEVPILGATIVNTTGGI